MDSVLPSYDDECPKSTYSIELAYREILRQTDLLLKDEEARRLRLRVLLLEDENDGLHGQLAIEDDRIDKLEQDRAELQRQVEEAEVDSHRRETDLRAKARELSNLKAELSSMNGLSVDSAKLLTEKLSLARDLTTLKPELDHLRSQVAYQQTVLAEKLALQRQLSTLEVELETEKRASRRAGHRIKGSEKETELSIQLDELRKELAKEERERERAQKISEKNVGEWESRKAALENKVEQLRTKLRQTKEQVTELQTDLAQAQAATMKAPASTVNGEISAKEGRKRTAVQMSADSVIGTPDGVAVRGKRPTTRKGKADQNLLGEKSMFSVTPFLNRTINVAPETPRDEAAVLNGKDGEVDSLTPVKGRAARVVEEETTNSKINAPSPPGPILKHVQMITEKQTLTDSKNGKLNTKPPSKKLHMITTLEKVTEEGVDENAQPTFAAVPIGKMKFPLQPQVMAIDGKEPKKKKRKFLGTAKTLFDEEDGETTKRPAKTVFGPLKSLSKSRPMGNKNGLQGGLGGGFGTFSPLKKDRRGAQGVLPSMTH